MNTSSIAVEMLRSASKVTPLWDKLKKVISWCFLYAMIGWKYFQFLETSLSGKLNRTCKISTSTIILDWRFRCETKLNGMHNCFQTVLQLWYLILSQTDKIKWFSPHSLIPFSVVIGLIVAHTQADSRLVNTFTSVYVR